MSLILSKTEIIKYIIEDIRYNLTFNDKLRFGDGHYQIPYMNECELMLLRSITDRREYIYPKGDCGKFAALFHADIIKSAWDDPFMEYAWCGGQTWGYFPENHAMNWFLVNMCECGNKPILQFWLAEPQNDGLRRLTAEEYIYFIFAV